MPSHPAPAVGDRSITHPLSWPRRGDARVVATTGCVVYLALPYLFFFWGWFKPSVAIPLIVALGFLSWWTVVRVTAPWLKRSSAAAGVPLKSYVVLLLASTAALAAFGVGGIFHETSDWIKHNTIFHLLIQASWPPTIATDLQNFQLAYYVAWYLPAALFGKVAGWLGANLFLLLFSAFGVSALMLLSSQLTGATLPVMFAVFLAFSGLDALGEFAIGHLTSLRSAANIIQHDDWWAAAFQYSGTITQLYYVPQQAIGGWLLTALMVAGIRYGRPMPVLAFCAPISLLWTPWLTIGLLPIGLYFCLKQVIQRPFRDLIFYHRNPASDLGAYLAGAAIGAALVVYYSLRFSVAETDFVPPPRGYLTYTPGIGYFTGLRMVMVYVLFVLVEIAGIVALLRWAMRDSKCRLGKELLAVSAAILLVLPAMRYGFFNDLVMRVSIPALFVLVLLAAFCLAQDTAKIKRTALAGFLALCFANALWANATNLARNVTTDWNFLMLLKEDEVLTPQCLHEMRGLQIRWNFLTQYVGKPYLAIHRLILKSPGPDSDGGIGRLPSDLAPGDDRVAAACG